MIFALPIACWYWFAARKAGVNRLGWMLGGLTAYYGVFFLLVVPGDTSNFRAILTADVTAAIIANLLCEILVQSLWLQRLLTEVFRLPGTLYLYILRELMRILLLATVVLVTVIGFAVAIKPLSEGLLDWMRLLLYVLMFAPTLLVFIIPFCGAFAGTLVFHRMSAENEITACSASGLSYRAILAPAACLGLGLTLGLFFMSNSVLPHFHRFSANIVQGDIISALVEKLQQGQAVSLDDRVVIYADAAADPFEPTKEMLDDPMPPDMLLVLEGVVIGSRTGELGRLRADGSAERAEFQIGRHQGDTWIRGHLENVTYIDPVRNLMVRQMKTRTNRILVPNTLRDDPRFLSWRELDDWRRNPHRYDRVRQVKSKLAQAMASTILLDRIQSALSPDQPSRVQIQGDLGGEWYQLSAALVSRDNGKLILREAAGQPVLVQQFNRADVHTRDLKAPLAVLTIESADSEYASAIQDNPDTQHEPVVKITLDKPFLDDRPENQQTNRTRHEVIGRLRADPIYQPLAQISPASLMQSAQQQSLNLNERSLVQESLGMQKLTGRLRTHIEKLQRKIDSQLHQRAALATCGLLTLLIAATLSIKLKDRMPLTVYFWAFLMTIASLLITYNGENFATDLGYRASIGLGIIWMGVVSLAAVLAGVYLRLSRN